MMDNRKKKRQKVYISYAIAIVLPCIVLGILAYRGIKNDQALLERELRISSLELGQRTNEGLVQYLNSIESLRNPKTSGQFQMLVSLQK